MTKRLLSICGSGTKKIFRYTPLYSNGKEPQIEEQDVYRITIPLDSESLTVDTTEKTTEKILAYIRQTPDITNEKLAQLCNMTVDGVYYHTQKLRKAGVLERVGGRNQGYWKIIDNR